MLHSYSTFILISTFFLINALTAYPTNHSESVVGTTSGLIRGIVTDTHRAFIGIPYATAGRFEPPKPAPSWDGIRDAFEFGDRFPQGPSPLSGNGPFEPTNVTQSENGHHINVFTPRLERIPAGGLPVMVWIYGGSFTDGSSDIPLYNIPSFLNVTSDTYPTIVVTFNYRLNIFGFLASAELAESSPNGSAGNYGLMDQTAALEWVRDNIEGFGGDKGKVTVFGESAGAFSVGYQTILTRSLIHRAILQSGVAAATPPSIATVQPLFDRLLQVTNYSSTISKVEHLKSVPWQVLLTKGLELVSKEKFRVGPVMDGVLIKESPMKSLREGRVDAGIREYVIGCNKDEGTLFTADIKSEPDLDAYILTLVPAARVEEVKKLYPVGTPHQRAAAMLGDARFQQPARAVARTLAGKNGVGVLKYRWEKPMEATRGMGAGVHHAVELPFLFQSRFLTPSERPAAQDIARKWARFATDGTVGDGTEWGRYGVDGGNVYVFGENGSGVGVEEKEDDRLDFWEGVNRLGG